MIHKSPPLLIIRTWSQLKKKEGAYNGKIKEALQQAPVVLEGLWKHRTTALGPARRLHCVTLAWILTASGSTESNGNKDIIRPQGWVQSSSRVSRAERNFNGQKPSQVTLRGDLRGPRECSQSEELCLLMLKRKSIQLQRQWKARQATDGGGGQGTNPNGRTVWRKLLSSQLFKEMSLLWNYKNSALG